MKLHSGRKKIFIILYFISYLKTSIFGKILNKNIFCFKKFIKRLSQQDNGELSTINHNIDLFLLLYLQPNLEFSNCFQSFVLAREKYQGTVKKKKIVKDF